MADLKIRIESGELKAGDRLPSFADLQEQFGVSPNTANRALIALEHAGLVVREHKKGTFVKARAARVKQGVIGLSGRGFEVSDQLTYWAGLLSGIQQAASREQVRLMLLPYQDTAGWEKVDGLIIYDWAGSPQVTPMVPSQLPAVCVLESLPGFPSVLTDDRAGMRMATEYLLSHGHRRIAYLHERHHEPRMDGYRSALTAAGITPDPRWMKQLAGHLSDGGYEYTVSGRSSMRTWLREGWQKLGCTAVLAHNDETAFGVLEALTEAGLRVPEDVSVVGFDGTYLCDRSSPGLTSVEVPLKQIGEMALRLLLNRIEAESLDGCGQGETIVLPPRIQVRASTGSPSPAKRLL